MLLITLVLLALRRQLADEGRHARCLSCYGDGRIIGLRGERDMRDGSDAERDDEAGYGFHWCKEVAFEG